MKNQTEKFREKSGKGEKKMKPEKSLISGSTAMLILKLLSEKDMYGYEMIETLQECSCTVRKQATENKR